MSFWKATASVCVLAALTGCAVGPDFKQPAPPATPRITAQPLPGQTASAVTTGGTAQAFVSGGDVPADWWTLFNSPVLNRLVQDALAASPTLDAARAALKIANENAAVERAAFFPGLSAGFDATRQQTSQVLSPVLNGPAQTFNLFTPQLSLSYSPDLWGGVRRSVEIRRRPGAGAEICAACRASDPGQQCRGGRDPVRLAAGPDRGPAENHCRRRADPHHDAGPARTRRDQPDRV